MILQGWEDPPPAFWGSGAVFRRTVHTDLCIRHARVYGRCDVARRISRRRGNTGRQRQVVP